MPGGMTKGLYDLIGADPENSAADLRDAYARGVAQVMRRRRAVLEQGGSPDTLDLERARMDEAWEILSDPSRRRRYDVWLKLQSQGDIPSGDALWRAVLSTVPPAETVNAVEVVRALTQLRIRNFGEGSDSDEDHVPTEVEQGSAPVVEASPVAPEPENVVPFQSDSPRESRGTDYGFPTSPKWPVAEATEIAPAAVVPLPRAQVTSSPPAAPMDEIDLQRLVHDYGWTGAMLRAVREKKGLSLDEIGSATKISNRYLDAIERDEHQQLPSATFVRGYLRELARVLGIDEKALVDGYLRHMV